MLFKGPKGILPIKKKIDVPRCFENYRYYYYKDHLYYKGTPLKNEGMTKTKLR